MFACPHYLEGEQEGFGLPQLLAILEDFHALDGLRAGELGKCLPAGQRGEGCSGHRSEVLHPNGPQLRRGAILQLEGPGAQLALRAIKSPQTGFGFVGEILGMRKWGR